MSLTVSAPATSSTISISPGSSWTIPPPTTLSTVATSTSDGSPLITAGPFPPMTTHWNRPLSCTWTYVVDTDLPPGVSDPIAYLDLEPLPGASTLSCYPDGMFFDGRTGVFSPATCPYGWTTVSVSVNTERMKTENEDEVTTTALCCSSEYSWAGGHCKRQVPTVLAVPIIYNRTAATYEVLTNSTTTLYSATIAVNTIRALFREKDKPLLGLTDEDDIDDHKNDDQGLSLSAKIGIGVGVALGSLFAIGAAIFIFMWKRERRKKGSTGRPSHELRAVQRAQGRMYSSSHTQVRARDSEPPPAYASESEINNAADNDSGSTAVTRGGEIRVLIAQKAAIQRRIEELERDSGEESRDGPYER
ncbi:uncharacterized protein TrAFT101_003899 [Trichoderma asperellum]|uniref:uncharacterized protein n=1 Tax=Trichoderma asperellum TaxID=101201 RepID=UPI003319FDF5|nr:hypothetical protein TrAFT101_003899 [Trichoderma asperellum]